MQLMLDEGPTTIILWHFRPTHAFGGFCALKDRLEFVLRRFDFVWGQIRPRDFCWASEGDVVPLTDYFDELKVGLQMTEIVVCLFGTLLSITLELRETG